MFASIIKVVCSVFEYIKQRRRNIKQMIFSEQKILAGLGLNDNQFGILGQNNCLLRNGYY